MVENTICKWPEGHILIVNRTNTLKMHDGTIWHLVEWEDFSNEGDILHRYEIVPDEFLKQSNGT